MVETVLPSTAMIDSGAKLLEAMDNHGFAPESAGWLMVPPLKEYRYIVATSAVDLVGRRKIYGGIVDLFSAYDFGGGIDEFDVHLAAPRENPYRYIASLFSLGGARISFQDCMIDGVPLNAYIYRLYEPKSSEVIRRQVARFTKEAKRAAEAAA